MRFGKKLLGLVVVAGLLGIAACSGSSTTNTASSGEQTASRTIKHDKGETTIDGPVNRVVALEFSFVDALLTLDVDPVGIADDNDKERITQLAGKELDYTSVGTRNEPNQEIIASLQPDLIIADTDRHSQIYDQLSKIAPTIVLNSREGSYQDMKDNTVTIAEALGEKQKGEDVVKQHEAKMQEITKELNPEKKRSVQLVTARADSLHIATDTSFVGSVIETVGVDVPVKSDKAYEEASLERIAEVNPDVLLIASDVKDPITSTWEGNPVWDNMKANTTPNSKFDVDRNLYTRFRGLGTAEHIAQDVIDKLNK
jgi:Fe(3+)-citrate-binding protein yfmC